MFVSGCTREDIREGVMDDVGECMFTRKEIGVGETYHEIVQ